MQGKIEPSAPEVLVLKRNVGTLDAYLRIAVGVVGIAWALGRMSRPRMARRPAALLWFSAMKIAEGLTRFCPVMFVFGTSSRQWEQRMKKWEGIIPAVRFKSLLPLMQRLKNTALETGPSQREPEQPEPVDHFANKANPQELPSQTYRPDPLI